MCSQNQATLWLGAGKDCTVRFNTVKVRKHCVCALHDLCVNFQCSREVWESIGFTLLTHGVLTKTSVCDDLGVPLPLCFLRCLQHSDGQTVTNAFTKSITWTVGMLKRLKATHVKRLCLQFRKTSLSFFSLLCSFK